MFIGNNVISREILKFKNLWLFSVLVYLSTIMSSRIIFRTASVVQWSEFLATDTEVSGSNPGATRFSE